VFGNFERRMFSHQFDQSLATPAAIRLACFHTGQIRFHTGQIRFHTGQIRFHSAGGAQPMGRLMVASRASHFPRTLTSR
jgi:hypothetical protein